MSRTRKIFFMVQESIKHFPIPLRKSFKVIAEGDFLVISIISLALFLYSSICFASEIEIRPVLEGEDYYIMELGESQTFEARGFGWDKAREEKIPNIGIKAIQWSFDSRFLELVEKKNNTITLKAIRKRTSKLTVTGKIDDKYATKTIFIVIGEGK